MPDPLVLNPDFDVDLSNWALTDTAPASVTWTRDTTTVHSGAGSSKLVNTSAGADDFIGQFVDSAGLGLIGSRTYLLTAWLNVTSFTAAAVSNRGLMVVSQPSNAVAISDDITAATSGWVQKLIVFQLPTTDTGISIRLYAPQATLFWDDVSLLLVRSFFPRRMPLGV
jgi:hypothetical protein